MAWVVDTCVLLDVARKDPTWGLKSATLLDQHLAEGLAVCPISAIEITPQFGGNFEEVRRFLAILGAQDAHGWQDADTRASAQGWFAYVTARRRNPAPKRPIADILIGAFASRFQGLITRNPGHFQSWFPQLRLLNPATLQLD